MSNNTAIDFHPDENLLVEKEIKRDDLVWRNARSAPFLISGVYYDGGKFRRLPEEVAMATSSAVHFLHANTSGGRIRFKTNSRFVAINAKYSYVCRFAHFSLTGSAGFDLYAKDEGEDIESFRADYSPPYDMTDGYESRFEMDDERMREITINMPLYSDITDVEIGLSEGAVLLAPEPYRAPKPIVYYGNSITQGACASRPGNGFAAYAARQVGCDHINLGFSGSGRGEVAIAEYIASLDMQIFVCDYDHNAPSVEHLAETHERLFKTVRSKHPTLPIVLMTRTSFGGTGKTFKYSMENAERRREVIKRTYDNAIAAGDKNVYYIDGSRIFGDLRGEATVEGVHPNDLGHVLMGKALAPVLEEILKGQTL